MRLLIIIGLFEWGAVYYGEKKADYSKKAFIIGVWGDTNPIREFFEKSGRFPNATDIPDLETNFELKTDLYDTGEHHMLTGKVYFYDRNFELRFNGISSDGERTIIVKPVHGTDDIYWDCTEGTLENKYRPSLCL